MFGVAFPLHEPIFYWIVEVSEENTGAHEQYSCKIHCFNCQLVIDHSFEELNNAFLFVAITEVEVNWGDILAMPILNLFVNAASSAA